jgi:hypothetical protein
MHVYEKRAFPEERPSFFDSSAYATSLPAGAGYGSETRFL